MQIRADNLVRAAMDAEAIPEDRPSVLAKRLGLQSYSAPKRIARWLKGENAPQFDETISLLEMAGWLDEAAIRRWDAQVAARAAEEAESKIPARRKRTARERPGS